MKTKWACAGFTPPISSGLLFSSADYHVNSRDLGGGARRVRYVIRGGRTAKRPVSLRSRSVASALLEVSTRFITDFLHDIANRVQSP